MELTLLLSSLSENSYHTALPLWPVDINDFRILDGSPTELHSNILYLGSSEHLPALAGDTPCSPSLYMVRRQCRRPIRGAR